MLSGAWCLDIYMTYGIYIADIYYSFKTVVVKGINSSLSVVILVNALVKEDLAFAQKKQWREPAAYFTTDLE